MYTIRQCSMPGRKQYRTVVVVEENITSEISQVKSNFELKRFRTENSLIKLFICRMEVYLIVSQEIYGL